MFYGHRNVLCHEDKDSDECAVLSTFIFAVPHFQTLTAVLKKNLNK